MVCVILYLWDGKSYPVAAGWEEVPCLCVIVRVILYLRDGKQTQHRHHGCWLPFTKHLRSSHTAHSGSKSFSSCYNVYKTPNEVVLSHNYRQNEVGSLNHMSPFPTRFIPLC
ncbi:hypothetical protein RRG08_065260 [Elysia crispata]|uniref:Uncharacterized protein n=1 Tax=Elysia crispata TaxID=231223 RepID=A0AAE0ZTD7_9GAST|nr:hypothetical protein RRG08_065260 [Elysia crispata]